ncbi:MAG: peptidoglycan editing factor PgeF [Alphaproteobacteria bacterium]|nr:peptidoglycan editing factor PgeF [Alphaproteobacteria bacterium]
MQADNLKELRGIRHGFFTRLGGVSEGCYAELNCGLSSDDTPEAVAENRRRVAAHLDVDSDHLLTSYQIHSPDVVTVTKPWRPEERPRADAMVTKTPGLALGILTADCVPILFADAKAGVIGAAHAGWRGALGGVIETTLDAMEKLGASRSSIRAALGPCIWRFSYEVGLTFPAPFLAENPAHKSFFQPTLKEGHFLFDLPGYVRAKLCAARLSDIAPSPANTFTDEARFFSYRRNCLAGKEGAGRLISAIVL